MFNMLFDTAISQPKTTSPQILRDVVVVRDFIGVQSSLLYVTFRGYQYLLLLDFYSSNSGLCITCRRNNYLCLGTYQRIKYKRSLSEANKSNIAANNEAISSVRNAEVVKRLE